MLEVYNTVRGNKTEAELASFNGSWVDVRDLASAHVLAAQKAEAGGERMIVSGGKFFLQDLRASRFCRITDDVTNAPPGD